MKYDGLMGAIYMLGIRDFALLYSLQKRIQNARLNNPSNMRTDINGSVVEWERLQIL